MYMHNIIRYAWPHRRAKVASPAAHRTNFAIDAETTVSLHKQDIRTVSTNFNSK